MNVTDFIRLRLKNAERKIAKRLKREKLRRDITDTLDALMFGESDLVVKHLPPVRNTMAQVQLRDAILANCDIYDEDELAVALLFLRGFSPRTVFTTLGIPPSTAYRKFGHVLDELREVCHE